MTSVLTDEGERALLFGGHRPTSLSTGALVRFEGKMLLLPASYIDAPESPISDFAVTKSDSVICQSCRHVADISDVHPTASPLRVTIKCDQCGEVLNE